MAGRKPKPTVLKELAGNPGHRPLNKGEPKPAAGAPKPPAHLTKDARTEWVRLQRSMGDLGLLTEIDRGAFEGYCEAYSTWIRAKRVVAKKGFTVESKGMTRKRPEVSIMEQAARSMRQFAEQFGMTPSSRSRVTSALIDPSQPALPGMEKLPEQRDPSKPALPAMAEELTDDDYFGGGTRH